ncbi:glutaredoxin [Natrinema sp. CBA1119]|uniref:glutathione S-transferase N-terminal domain-containing protein n=1 Tax=Natrinema sp. CBA1119 TaxID=1608465 RepID=UPI000BF77BAB|nr:glutathione S-transferase N-terminal domain-containing protein [Natrinema sp. CBA1119]PGF16631.1 glutaredoxin [Natrinema sp. CBA1119]
MLALYQAEDCPHSVDVREKLTALGGSYVTHNPRRPGGNREVLNEWRHGAMIGLGGEDPIPFLVDTDREESRYESDEIVDYLEKHYG